MSRRASAAALLVLACSVSAACSSGSGSATPSRTASPTASPTVSPPSSATPAAVTRPVLILEPDGLGVLVGEASIRHLPFASTTAAQITSVVRTVLGPGAATALPECGQGARSSYRVKGFSVLLDGTRFVGWHDQGAPGRTLSAADGTGIGITLAKLRRLHPGVKVSSDTLGPEFVVGDAAVNGFLSGTTAASTVTSVYAGETCLFR
jgi:hypothetical protein